MTDQLANLNRFSRKEYRDGYLHTRVRSGIAYQIQALRSKFIKTQEQFAELTGKKQSTISRLENPDYGRVSVQTLLDIASACGLALIVRFVSYPEFLAQTANTTERALQPDTIDETLAGARPAPPPPPHPAPQWAFPPPPDPSFGNLGAHADLSRVLGLRDDHNVGDALMGARLNDRSGRQNGQSEVRQWTH